MHSIINDRELGHVSNRTVCAGVTGSSYYVERLKLDRKLEVHNGCVNTVCWNDSGTLLLSGSDDQHLVVTDPFTGKIVTRVRSGHRSNIFCARFLPGSHDREVVSCSGSGDIFYTDLDREDFQDVNRFGCHFGTTYKIVVVPNEASTFLSCGDDGTVRFFDLRVKSNCSRMNCEEDIIINLQNSVSSMAVDPVIPYQLAVGSADGIVRVYDRRMLKAKEKGGNPKSLICVFQSPMSKMEKRHFRITSLNYRPGAHDVLVNYSSENIYLFNTYDMETTQNYSMEVPKATPERKSPLLRDAVSLGGSTENDEMEEDLGFSPDERRGPSTLYRPIRRLRLRGDWSDTGPNARPENEAQAPTSMIMQRMSDLLTRMLNTHVNEPSPEATEAQDDSSARPASGAADTNTANSGVVASNDLPSAAGTNQAMPSSLSLPIMRLRSQSEERQSISSEGLVSPELSSVDSAALADQNNEEDSNITTSNSKCVDSAALDHNNVEDSNVTITSNSKRALSHIGQQDNEDVKDSNNMTMHEDCTSTSSHTMQKVPSEASNRGGPESQSKTTGGEASSPTRDRQQQSPIAQCDVDEDDIIIVNKNNGQNSDKQVSPNDSHSSNDIIALGGSQEETLTQNQNDHKTTSAALDCENIENISDCTPAHHEKSDVVESVFDQCGVSIAECLSSESKCGGIVTGGGASAASSCKSVEQLGHCSRVSNYSGSDCVVLSGSTSTGETVAFANEKIPRFDSDSSQSTLDDITTALTSPTTSIFSLGESLSFVASPRDRKSTENGSVVPANSCTDIHSGMVKDPRETLPEKTLLSLQCRNCGGGVMDARLPSSGVFGNGKEILECDSCTKKSDHCNADDETFIPTSHPLKTVKEENVTEATEEGEQLVGRFTLQKSNESGKTSRERHWAVSNDKDKDVSFLLFDSGHGKSYTGKGKGVGKSSKQVQQGGGGADLEKNTTNAPYNDGNMKISALEKKADSEKASRVGDDSHSTGCSDERTSPSKLAETSAGPSRLLDARTGADQMSDQGGQKVPVPSSCLCAAVSSTSTGSSRTGKFSGDSHLRSSSITERHRRAGYSLPPTGNFQLHSDDEEEDDVDDATRIRKGQQSKSHAARKIQELFRKRRHAKENARLLNLPQPRVQMKFSGHRNCRTMIKESNFYGDKYVMSGSDCGRIFIWERETGNLAMYLDADKHVVNCVQPNPHLPVIASSGIDYNIKLWAPLADEPQFDADVAHTIMQRNELMLVETRDTITVPPAFMLRVLASLSHIRAGRTAAQAEAGHADDQPPAPDEQA